jgi:hypothetical protein
MYSIIEIEWMLKQYKLMIMSLNFSYPHENIPSYLYVHRLRFEYMTYVCKLTYEPRKKQFLHVFHYQIMGWEVCDEVAMKLVSFH